jgi:hypothetical protein
MEYPAKLTSTYDEVVHLPKNKVLVNIGNEYIPIEGDPPYYLKNWYLKLGFGEAFYTRKVNRKEIPSMIGGYPWNVGYSVD